MKKLLLGVLVIVAGAAAYAWIDYQSRNGRDALMIRAHEYWEAIKINDLATAYRMEAEAVLGTMAPHEVELRHDWGSRVVGYQLGDVTISKDTAVLDLSMEVTRPHSHKTRIIAGRKDAWTFIKGQWCHGVSAPGSSMMRRHALPDPVAAPWNPFN